MLVLFTIVVGVWQFTRGAQEAPLMAGLAAVVAVAATAGHNRFVFVCFGLALTSGLALVGPVPGAVVIPIAASVGGLLRRFARREPGALESVPYALAAVAVSMYWFIQPPVTNAGQSTAFSLALIPAWIGAMTLAVGTRGSRRRDCAWFGVGAALPVGVGLLQSYESVTDYAVYEVTRSFDSSIGSSNLAAGLAVGAGMILLGVRTMPEMRMRTVLLLASVPFLLAPIVFASRGALLAALVGIAALVTAPGNRDVRGYSLPPARFFLILATPVLLIVAAFAARERGLFIWDRLTDQSGVGITSGRIELWQFSWNRAVDHPVFGLGPGHLTDLLLTRFGFAYSHNLLLDIVAQLGLLGGSIYLWILFRAGWRTWSPFLPATLALLVDSLVEPNATTSIGGPLLAGVLFCHRYWVESSAAIAADRELNDASVRPEPSPT